ncbi:hypothetical protein BT96DRAFT_468323 [Gymnopus androsaceus JB14]|uniref:DUF6593 domain-containing protein n=1 Tax=Gymnopus androsaceus JB14 TaxID=1447944 RepID=A0A6A4IJH7_9AGAR|nr:hypothetical protein BT96DRAFT_468323 [Gymnopus androsaceus JB14]
MDLVLVQNDPARTDFITSDGIPLYTSRTQELLQGKAKCTTVRRFERESSLAAQTLELALGCYSTGDVVVETERKNSWKFTGPDFKPYKWQIFIQYPVLILDDNSQLPLARYKRAKLGIVSRPRRPSLEIFSAGINSLDLIVVTFVSFMIYRFAGTDNSSSTSSESSPG